MRIPTLTVLLALGVAGAIPAADRLFESCWNKFERIDSGQAKRGSVTVFTPAELNAWIAGRVPQMLEGIRDPRLQLESGAATGTAFVDFAKIGKGLGHSPNGLLSKLIEGERPIKVSARLESGQGSATVFLTSVELSGVTLSGSVLNFLVKDFFTPLFPDARINQPFELRDNMERIEVRPDAVRVTMKK